MKKSDFFPEHLFVVASLLLIGFKVPEPLDGKDPVWPEIRVPFTNILHCPRILQAAIDLNTMIFQGQGVSAAVIIKDHVYWTGTSGYSEPGKTVSAEIQGRFLKPLGLDHTIAVDVGTQMPSQFDIAHGWFDVNGDGEPEDISGDSQNWITSMSPNMMYASAIDLARWSQALYEGRVLSEASLGQMLDFHRPTPGEPPVTGYGLGAAEIAVKGLIRSYGHLGLHYGNMSAMLYLPKFKTSIVVLTNGNNQPFQYIIGINLLTAIILRQLRYFLYAAVLVILFFVLRKNWKQIFRRQEK